MSSTFYEVKWHKASPEKIFYEDVDEDVFQNT
jgi:hypothetical protein